MTLSRPFVTEHALRRYRELVPGAGFDDVAACVRNDNEVDVGVAGALTRSFRRTDGESRFFRTADGGGLLVVAETADSRGEHRGQPTVVTVLRLGEVQRDILDGRAVVDTRKAACDAKAKAGASGVIDAFADLPADVWVPPAILPLDLDALYALRKQAREAARPFAGTPLEQVYRREHFHRLAAAIRGATARTMFDRERMGEKE